MPEAIFKHDGDSIAYTAGADIAVGEVVVVGEYVGIATEAIANGATGTLYVEGVFACAKATTTGSAIVAGDLLYWDAGNDVVATSAGTGDPILGRAVAAATDSDTTVLVKLARG